LATAVEEHKAQAPAGLDFRETAEMVSSFFGWKPDPVARLLIRALSGIMSPLEQGSYEGRRITGEPHRASWVIASPINIFVVPRDGYWRKIVLAARLRHVGDVNIVAVGPGVDEAWGNARFRKKARATAGRFRADARRFDSGAGPLETLVWIQRESDVSLRLIPVARTSHQLSPDSASVSVATRAYRLSPQSLVRRASSLARTFRTGRVKNCRPVVLSKRLASLEGIEPVEQAAALRVDLMGNIESQRRACAGPPVLPVREVKRRVLADPLLASYMQDYALGQGTTRDAVLEESRGYIDEIASDYRVGVVRWFARAVDFVFDRVLTDLEVDRAGIQFLSECDSRSRIVLVCSHKSYLDPLLIGYTLFRSGMVPPQQAAGLNLNFWPVGWLLRHSGAFYLRRTFAGETLYKEVFSAYVRYLLAENHIIVVYIEGTRSRDGKLAKPKTGFMGIVEDSLRMGICQDIKMVPVYLGYDKTPEESAHVREMAGGRKVSESVKGFGRIYRSVNTRLGRAYVKFGEPMSMRLLLETQGLDGACAVACDGINRVTPVTARGLAAGALLAEGDVRVAHDDARRAARALLDFAERRGLPLAVDADMEGVMGAVDWFAAEGHVTPADDGEEGWRIDANGRRFLEYNKNLVLNHFLEASLEAVAGRGHAGNADGEGQREEVLAFLRDLFEEEFVFSPAAGPGVQLAETGPEEREVFASLVESYLEGYLVALRAAGAPGSGGVSRDEMIERCFTDGERMLKDGAINRPEGVSKTTMVNAVRRFVTWGALTERREKVEGHKDKVTLSKGPRFERLARTEERLNDLLSA
jgi:1-acyl-sn-glycerol-3-phosphate acyltransferase